MQRLLVVLLLGLALPVQAQNHTTEPKNNGELNNKSLNTVTNGTNSNIPYHQAPQTEPYSVADSTKIAPVMLESVGKKPLKEKKAVSRSPRVEELKASDFEEMEKEEAIDTPSAASQTSKMKQQFQLNQSSSSRQYTRRSASDLEQLNMDASVSYYRAILPDAFETHFFAYLAGHYNTDLYSELEAAAALKPEDTEVRKQLAAYHIINGDAEQAVPIIRELIDTGAVSNGQLFYANDLLASGAPNATIVLHGFDDMFATYYVQNSSGVRPDVQLLSLDFMQSATYRNNWTASELVLPEDNKAIDTAYLAELCRLNPNRPMQLSMTIPKDYFTALRAKLYPEGLTFRYSETPVDLHKSNYSLWSGGMNLELVERPGENDKDKQWSANYLPMLVTLRKQLELMGRKKEVEQLDRQILAIGARTHTTDKVKKYTKN